MATSSPSPRIDLAESLRRRPSARGTPVLLADGREWLLASPIDPAHGAGLDSGAIAPSVDRLFDCLVFNEPISLTDIWSVAIPLLHTNYQLTDEELCQLLSVAPGAESGRLATAVLEVLFGSERFERSYSRWVRASLVANGLGNTEIAAPVLPDVLAILVATKRTVPVWKFVESCKRAQEWESMESLV